MAQSRERLHRAHGHADTGRPAAKWSWCTTRAGPMTSFQRASHSAFSAARLSATSQFCTRFQTATASSLARTKSAGLSSKTGSSGAGAGGGCEGDGDGGGEGMSIDRNSGTQHQAAAVSRRHTEGSIAAVGTAATSRSITAGDGDCGGDCGGDDGKNELGPSTDGSTGVRGGGGT